MGNRFFGTDGIRGVAGTHPLTPDGIMRIGIAAGTVLKDLSQNGRPVIIGRDTRESGEWITEQLARGLVASGIQVVDAGIITTPGISYLVRKKQYAAGVVISASHNPAEYNGIKFFSSSGIKLDDAVEDRIEQELDNDRRTSPPDTPVIRHVYDDGVKEYTAFLQQLFPAECSLKGRKIVIDCAQGAAFKIAPEVLTGLGADVIPIAVEPDGKNINDGCGSLHLQKMYTAVQRHHAWCGFSLDGDADRVIFTDEKASAMDGDHLLALLASDLKSKGTLRGDILITTVMANLGLMRAMEERGIKVIQTAVGDRYVYESMVTNKAVIGGEQSGHIILSDRLQTGDGLVTALAVLQVLCESGKPLSEFTRMITKYPQVLINIPVTTKIPVHEISGFSVQEDRIRTELGKDGRVVTRYSGTEHCLRVMIEGKHREDIQKKADLLAGIVRQAIGTQADA